MKHLNEFNFWRKKKDAGETLGKPEDRPRPKMKKQYLGGEHDGYINMGDEVPEKEERNFVEVILLYKTKRIYSKVHDAIFLKFDTEEAADKFVEETKEAGVYKNREIKSVRTTTQTDFDWVQKTRKQGQ